MPLGPEGPHKVLIEGLDYFAMFYDCRVGSTALMLLVHTTY